MLSLSKTELFGMGALDAVAATNRLAAAPLIVLLMTRGYHRYDEGPNWGA